MNKKTNTLSDFTEIEFLRGENLILHAQNEYLMNRIEELYKEIISINHEK